MRLHQCLDAELAGYPSDSRRGAGDEPRNQVNWNQVGLNESESIRAHVVAIWGPGRTDSARAG